MRYIVGVALALVCAGDVCSMGTLPVLSEHGCGRATAYSEFNKIVTIGGKTHVFGGLGGS